jgi:peptide/nickel transport system permease protein
MEAIQLLRKRPWGIAGAVIILLVVLIGLVGPLVAPYHSNEMTLDDRLQPPSVRHIFGTDNLGRDIFSRFLYGARVYVIPGLEAIGLALAGGLLLGFLSGRFKGKIDTVIRYAVLVPSLVLAVLILFFEVMNMPYIWYRFMTPLPIPFFLVFPAPFLQRDFLMAAGPVLGPNISIVLMTAFALFFLPVFYRVFRQIFLPGPVIDRASPGNVFSNHVILTLVPLTLVGIAVAVGIITLVTMPLDALGLGYPPPAPTWGNMAIGVATRRFLTEAPWMYISSLVTITVSEIGIVLLGLSLREIWMPRLAPPLLPSISNISSEEIRNIGFWRRWLAAFLDVLVFAVAGLGIQIGLQRVESIPLIYGLSWGIAAVYTFLFWLWAGATPGKMLMRIKVVPVKGGDLTMKQVLLRILGYLLSFLTLGIGFILIALDKDGRGLPDRMAGTAIVKV